jgi:group I intron endonuclease
MVSMKSGIYKITFQNGKFYIGSAKNLVQRKRQHFSNFKIGNHANDYMQKCYNKYGEPNFATIIICNPKDLIFFEQLCIDNLKPVLNICKIAGNTLGRKHTQESLKKITEANRLNATKDSWRKGVSTSWFKKGESRQMTEIQKKKIGKSWIGKKHKESSKILMSISAKNRELGTFNLSGLSIGREICKKKVMIRKIGDNQWLYFDSIRDAAIHVNSGSLGKISAALAGKNYKLRNVYKKHEWNYAV